MFLAYVTEADALAWVRGKLSDGELWTRPLPLPGEPLALWVVRVNNPRELLTVHRQATREGRPVIFNASAPTIQRLGQIRADVANGSRFYLSAESAANGGKGRKSRARVKWGAWGWFDFRRLLAR